jgi:ParB-like chromosome segregation protein Spo0J
MKQPIDTVEWVDVEALHANDYNPNKVFTMEMRLLATSIQEDGWTQPIVARPDGEIVDGFHRWCLAREVEGVAVDGKVPVAYLNHQGRSDQMLSTIRHNRARGHHGVVQMGDIVRALLADGFTAEQIRDRLGMEPEEIDRLQDTSGMTVRGSRDSFGFGWVPGG